MYGVLRKFLNTHSAIETMRTIADSLLNEATASGYEKYEVALCFRVLFEKICRTDLVIKPPRELEALSKEEILSLILRDCYNMSCNQIAAICSTSEGAIRTRLLNARIKSFASAVGTFDIPSSETFFNSVQDIEDADTFEELNRIQTINRSCPKSQRAIDLRKMSMDFFKNIAEEALPGSISEIKYNPILEKKDGKWRVHLSSAPWYYKIILEGVLATTLVVSIVFSMPKFKKIYEFWIERRLDLYSLTEFNPGSTDPSNVASNAAQTAPVAIVGLPLPQVTADKPIPKIEGKLLEREFKKLSSNKIYRILIKTDSPENLKNNVITTLSTVKIQAATKDLYSEIPAGVMFDIFVPLNSYIELRAKLKALGEASEYETNRRDEKTIPGKIHLKIWLNRT